MESVFDKYKEKTALQAKSESASGPGLAPLDLTRRLFLLRRQPRPSALKMRSSDHDRPPGSESLGQLEGHPLTPLSPDRPPREPLRSEREAADQSPDPRKSRQGGDQRAPRQSGSQGGQGAEGGAGEGAE